MALRITLNFKYSTQKDYILSKIITLPDYSLHSGIHSLVPLLYRDAISEIGAVIPVLGYGGRELNIQNPGEGGSKLAKSCLRSLWMVPNTFIYWNDVSIYRTRQNF